MLESLPISILPETSLHYWEYFVVKIRFGRYVDPQKKEKKTEVFDFSVWLDKKNFSSMENFILRFFCLRFNTVHVVWFLDVFKNIFWLLDLRSKTE